MSEQEFQAYMTGSITSVSAWESALVACESMHQLCEHLDILKGLSERNAAVRSNTMKLKEEMIKFQVCSINRDEIVKKCVIFLSTGGCR